MGNSMTQATPDINSRVRKRKSHVLRLMFVLGSKLRIYSPYASCPFPMLTVAKTNNGRCA